MTAAEIKNSDNTIIRTLDVPDDYIAPDHKYGPSHPTRIVPVVQGARPSFNTDTHYLAPLTTVETNRVVNGWQAVAHPIPDEVANWQLEEELADRGLGDGVNQAIAALPAGSARNKAKARFAKKPTIRRTDPLVPALAAALSLTSATVDDIFLKASRRT